MLRGMNHLSDLARTVTPPAPLLTASSADSTPDAPEPIMTTFLPASSASSS